MNPLVTSIKRLQALLRRRGAHREDAEDLVQEAFVRLQAYCNEGHAVRSPDAFLTRTVLNLAADARAANRGHLFVKERIEELELIDIGSAADEALAVEECLTEVRRLLAGVSPRTKDIFLMQRVYGLSYAQIAEEFDISISAVEKHIASAMAALGPYMHKQKWRP